MDILSHALWGWLYTKFANKNIKKKWNTKLTILFSIFPDIASFIPLTTWITVSLFFGPLTFIDILNIHHITGFTEISNQIIQNITESLYQISHSLFAFIAVFLICYLIFKRPIFELTGWLVHILIDIPTHSFQFFPTPFLWPISNFMFDGIAWSQQWFIILNYSSIIIMFILLRKRIKALPSKIQHVSQKSRLL